MFRAIALTLRARLHSQPLMRNSKGRCLYVFSCSQYSGRACVHNDDCAGRYYNQEARIA
jgi:hypothetical protein